MPLNRLEKILNFVKRTGDKAVLFDSAGEFVVMTLDDYDQVIRHGEDIKQMSEEELLKKINREIALWRESQVELDQIARSERLNKPYYSSLDELGIRREDCWEEDEDMADSPALEPELDRTELESKAINQENSQPKSGPWFKRQADQDRWGKGEGEEDGDNDELEDEIEDNWDNEDSFEFDEQEEDDKTIDSHSYDFVDNYLEDVKIEHFSQDDDKKRINNFGWENPPDTMADDNNFSPTLAKSSDESDQKNQSSGYDDIPPPPDVSSRRNEIPF